MLLWSCRLRSHSWTTICSVLIIASLAAGAAIRTDGLRCSIVAALGLDCPFTMLSDEHDEEGVAPQRVSQCDEKM